MLLNNYSYCSKCGFYTNSGLCYCNSNIKINYPISTGGCTSSKCEVEKEILKYKITNLEKVIALMVDDIRKRNPELSDWSKELIMHLYQGKVENIEK